MCIGTVTNTNIQFNRSSSCTCSIAQSCASSVIRSLLIRYCVRVGTSTDFYRQLKKYKSKAKLRNDGTISPDFCVRKNINPN